jgi:bifunctional non-homologous end joining protein LigD
MAQRVDGRVRLLTRKGTNFSNRFSQIVAEVTLLPVRSCMIDGEAVVCNEDGLAVFDLIRGYRHDTAAVLCAFDLLEVDGEDLRRASIEERKGILAKLLSHPHEGIAFNHRYTGDGAIIFKNACALGCEGIVSKRLGSSYRSGRADCWVKVKNPAAPAVTREADEDWDGKRRRW